MAGRQNRTSRGFTLNDGVDASVDAGSITDIDGAGGTDADSGGDGGNISSSSGGSDGRGTDPASVLGDADGGSTGGSVDGDDLIRDEHGNPTYSPTGRLRRRRQRRSGSNSQGKAKKNNKVSVTNADVAWFLSVAHLGASNMLRTPELELTQNEAKVLAEPITELLDFYDVEPPREVILWTKLFTALSYVYPPRFAMIKMRLDEERKKKAAERAARQQQDMANTIETNNGVSIGEVMPFDPGWTPPRH